MKLGSFILAALVLGVFLTGCSNRIEEYEPYSVFDDRMAAAEKGRPMTPDDQMSPGADEQQYASTSTGDQGFSNYDPSSEPAKMASGSGGGQSSEVPFDSSRSTKHATNIGAL